jgi:nicotinamidase-related amidase
MADTALLVVVDMLNAYRHPDAEVLAANVADVVEPLADLTGQVTEQCILYSALDAYVRHYSVVVPKDAVAHIDAGLGAAALAMMERNMSAEIPPPAHYLT